ncbi:MAG: hypothetical protein J6B68_02765 [Lachnospiraceae bacterium]|nr:hypothetical protein [Lachnospiraceae bacterium]
MNRKWIIFCSLGLLVAISLGILVKQKPLGNMKRNFLEPTTASSEVSFYADSGTQVKISFSSRIEKGTLNIVLYDSQENIVKELDQARELETYAVLEKEDVYTLVAEYNDFEGKFKVAVY